MTTKMYNYDRNCEGLKFYATTKIDDAVYSFIESGLDIAKMPWARGEYSNATSYANTLRSHLKRNRKDGTIKVRVRGDEVFMVKNH